MKRLTYFVTRYHIPRWALKAPQKSSTLRPSMYLLFMGVRHMRAGKRRTMHPSFTQKTESIFWVGVWEALHPDIFPTNVSGLYSPFYRRNYLRKKYWTKQLDPLALIYMANLPSGKYFSEDFLNTPYQVLTLWRLRSSGRSDWPLRNSWSMEQIHFCWSPAPVLSGESREFSLHLKLKQALINHAMYHHNHLIRIRPSMNSSTTTVESSLFEISSRPSNMTMKKGSWNFGIEISRRKRKKHLGTWYVEEISLGIAAILFFKLFILWSHETKILLLTCNDESANAGTFYRQDLKTSQKEIQRRP